MSQSPLPRGANGGDGGNGLTGETKERKTNGDSSTTKDTKITKRPFDWPPKAACRDVRGCRYESHRCGQRLVSAPSDITAVAVRRTPTIERPSPFTFVARFLL